MHNVGKKKSDRHDHSSSLHSTFTLDELQCLPVQQF